MDKQWHLPTEEELDEELEKMYSNVLDDKFQEIAVSYTKQYDAIVAEIGKPLLKGILELAEKCNKGYETDMDNFIEQVKEKYSPILNYEEADDAKRRAEKEDC